MLIKMTYKKGAQIFSAAPPILMIISLLVQYISYQTFTPLALAILGVFSVFTSTAYLNIARNEEHLKAPECKNSVKKVNYIISFAWSFFTMMTTYHIYSISNFLLAFIAFALYMFISYSLSRALNKYIHKKFIKQ